MSTTPRARLRWNGGNARTEVRQAAGRGLLLGAEHLLAESRKLVPIAEGVLERSGAASVDAQLLTAAVSYDTPYAVRVHEDLNARHLPGRTAKYLERPAAEQADTMRALVAAQVRRALRG